MPGVRKRDRAVSVHLPSWLPVFLLRPGPAQDALPYVAILIWYFFNLSVIFTNKRIFKTFPFPSGITLLHEVLGFCFSTALLTFSQGRKKTQGAAAAKPMSRWDRMVSLFPVAAAVTGNNFFSNWSIQASSVATAQTVKAIVPVFTLVIYKLYHGRNYGLNNYLAVGLVFGGVVVATFADSTLTTEGFTAGVLASTCAAFKVVFANKTTKSLNPVEASNSMAPYNISMLLVAFYLTEASQIPQYLDSLLTPQTLVLGLLHGILVFGLQQSGIFSTAVNSPVIQTTAGNMKLVLVYLFAWLLHGDAMGPAKLIGCLLTLVGGIWYTFLQRGFLSIADVLQSLRGDVDEAQGKDKST